MCLYQTSIDDIKAFYFTQSKKQQIKNLCSYPLNLFREVTYLPLALELYPRANKLNQKLNILKKSINKENNSKIWNEVCFMENSINIYLSQHEKLYADLHNDSYYYNNLLDSIFENYSKNQKECMSRCSEVAREVQIMIGISFYKAHLMYMRFNKDLKDFETQYEKMIKIYKSNNI